MTLRRAALIAPICLLLLAGCVPSAPEAVPTAGPSSPAPTASPNPTPTITPTPGPETEPVTVACSDLFTLQDLYDYNPNVSLLPSFSPSSSSPAGQALAQQGIACELVNQTSRITTDFGITRYTDEAFAAKSAAVAGSATPATSFDGYFDVTDGGGLAQVFVPPYFVTVQSVGAVSEGDLSELVTMALAHLG